MRFHEPMVLVNNNNHNSNSNNNNHNNSYRNPTAENNFIRNTIRIQSSDLNVNGTSGENNLNENHHRKSATQDFELCSNENHVFNATDSIKGDLEHSFYSHRNSNGFPLYTCD